MSGAIYLCGNPDRCEKHDRALHGYPCWACQEEWRETHPRTVREISKLAGGKGSAQAYRAAEKADALAAVQSRDREANR